MWVVHTVVMGGGGWGMGGAGGGGGCHIFLDRLYYFHQKR